MKVWLPTEIMLRYTLQEVDDELAWWCGQRNGHLVASTLLGIVGIVSGYLSWMPGCIAALTLGMLAALLCLRTQHMIRPLQTRRNNILVAMQFAQLAVQMAKVTKAEQQWAKGKGQRDGTPTSIRQDTDGSDRNGMAGRSP